MRNAFAAAVSVAFLALASSVGQQAIAAEDVSIAGAGPASLAYNMVAGIAENNNSKTDKVRLTAESSAGFVENIRLVGRGETELALTGASQVFHGLHGTGAYEGEPPYGDIRGVAVSHSSNISFNAREGITSIPELAGKTVSLGPPGSALGAIGELILDAYGIKDDVKLLRLSFEESSRAFVDGVVDAFLGGPAPYPAVMQASAQKAITILPVDIERIQEMQKVAPVIADTIPAGVYDWHKQDVTAVGFLGYVIANKNVSDDAVYEVLKTNLSPAGVDYLKNNHRIWKMWDTPRFIADQGAFAAEGLKLHPGAIRYWKEQGVTIPDIIRP